MPLKGLGCQPPPSTSPPCLPSPARSPWPSPGLVIVFLCTALTSFLGTRSRQAGSLLSFHLKHVDIGSPIWRSGFKPHPCRGPQPREGVAGSEPPAPVPEITLSALVLGEVAGLLAWGGGGKLFALFVCSLGSERCCLRPSLVAGAFLTNTENLLRAREHLRPWGSCVHVAH